MLGIISHLQMLANHVKLLIVRPVIAQLKIVCHARLAILSIHQQALFLVKIV